MSQQEEKPSQPKPTAKQLLDESVDDAARIIKNTETVTGTPRLILEGALLGFCLAFISTLLGISHLDAPLSHALITFCIVIPCLSYSLLFGVFKTRPVPGHLIVDAYSTWAWITGGIGQVIFVIGLAFIIEHFSSTACKVFVGTIICVMILNQLFPFISLFIYGTIMYKREQKSKTSTSEIKGEA